MYNINMEVELWREEPHRGVVKVGNGVVIKDNYPEYFIKMEDGSVEHVILNKLTSLRVIGPGPYKGTIGSKKKKKHKKPKKKSKSKRKKSTHRKKSTKRLSRRRH